MVKINFKFIYCNILKMNKTNYITNHAKLFFSDYALCDELFMEH